MRMSLTMMPVDDITSANNTAVPANRTSFVRIEALRMDFIRSQSVRGGRCRRC